MKRRLSEARRWTVYYQRRGSLAREYFECEADDRAQAMDKLTEHIKTKDLIIDRVIPAWPERSKQKGKQQ